MLSYDFFQLQSIALEVNLHDFSGLVYKLIGFPNVKVRHDNAMSIRFEQSMRLCLLCLRNLHEQTS